MLVADEVILQGRCRSYFSIGWAFKVANSIGYFQKGHISPLDVG